MRIEYMREFVAIHDEGNFSRAARSLFMTQPALSRHMQELERELGVRLIDRDRHSVSLTEAGAARVAAFREAHRRHAEEFLAPLSKEEKEALRDLLAKLIAGQEPDENKTTPEKSDKNEGGVA